MSKSRNSCQAPSSHHQLTYPPLLTTVPVHMVSTTALQVSASGMGCAVLPSLGPMKVLLSPAQPGPHESHSHEGECRAHLRSQSQKQQPGIQ